MKVELLQLEVEMLLLKYGETSVLKALATATTSTEHGLQEKIDALKLKKAKSAKPKFSRKQPLDIAKEVITGSANEDRLMRLAILYQNRQFLPQLKDVRRFLGRFNVTKNIKSRSDATRLVFESLDRCTGEELKEFASDSGAVSKSSYDMLADQIMGDHQE